MAIDPVQILALWFFLGMLVMVGSFDLLWNERKGFTAWMIECALLWIFWPAWAIFLACFALWLIRHTAKGERTGGYNG